MRAPQVAADEPRGRWLLALRVAWMADLLLALAITAASTPLLFERYGCPKPSPSGSGTRRTWRH